MEKNNKIDLKEVQKKIEYLPVPLANIDLVWDKKNYKFRIVYFNEDGSHFKDLTNLNEIFEADDENFIIPEYQIGGCRGEVLLKRFKELNTSQFPFLENEDKSQVKFTKAGVYRSLTPTRAFLTHFLLKQIVGLKLDLTKDNDKLWNEHYNNILERIGSTNESFIVKKKKNEQLAKQFGFQNGRQICAKFLQVINNYICPNYIPSSPVVYVNLKNAKENIDPFFYQQEIDSPVKSKSQHTTEQVLNF